MAVENLAIISSPLAGLAMNMQGNALGDAGTWMRSHGMHPSHVAIGAIAGAFLLGEGVWGGAWRGAALVAVVEAAYHHLAR